jgi:hypothetical protein
VCVLHWQDPLLQVAAVSCLCKLMCVSSEFCEANLQLLLTLLERSPSEVVRANIAIALGDMAICFNRHDHAQREGRKRTCAHTHTYTYTQAHHDTHTRARTLSIDLGVDPHH